MLDSAGDQRHAIVAWYVLSGLHTCFDTCVGGHRAGAVRTWRTALKVSFATGCAQEDSRTIVFHAKAPQTKAVTVLGGKVTVRMPSVRRRPTDKACAGPHTVAST